MNKLIKKQLDKCTVAKIEYVDDTHIIIKKKNDILPKDLIKGKIYEIEINKGLFNDQTLAINFNKGKYPNSELFVVEFINKLGNYGLFSGIVKNCPEKDWYGYFPLDSIKVIKEVV